MLGCAFPMTNSTQPKTFRETAFYFPHGAHQLAAVLHDAGRERLVVMAHGFTGLKSETGRLFVHMARELAAHGISALRFDFAGSGDSTGEFHTMTPNSEIADLQCALDWARRRRFRRVGVLGISMGGAVAICTVAARPAGEIAALCTWSSVPAFGWWRAQPDAAVVARENVMRVGRRFFSDRPKLDVPQAYQGLSLPKLQIQGDQDLPGFRERFTEFFASASAPKRHLVLPGADHVFTKASDRRRAMAETRRFFARWL